MNQVVMVLDDDSAFCLALKVSFKLKGYTVVIPSNLEPETIYDAIFAHQPAHILLDINLGEQSALELLKNIHSKLPVTTRIWLVSGMRNVAMEKYRRISSAVQPTWFGKPCKTETLLSAFALAEQQTFELPEGLKNLPLPLRVLDGEGNIIYNNPLWKLAANRPEPQEFVPFSEKKIPKVRQYWGALSADTANDGMPPGKTAFFYHLRSFPLWDRSHHVLYLAQTLEHSYAEDTLNSLDALVDRIFEVMSEAGFPCGRFYRIIDIPGTQAGLLSLEKINYPLTSDEALPLRHPLSGKFADRVKKYESVDKSEEFPLKYTILTKGEETALHDEHSDYWNNKAEADHSWLEIPVIRKYAAKENYRPAALFMFDRRGIAGIYDGKPEIITHAQVAIVAGTLRQILCDVIAALKEEENRNKLAWQSKLAPLDEKLLQIQKSTENKRTLFSKEQEEVEQVLLNAAVELSDAHSGFLISRDGNASFLSVRATRAKQDKKFPDCLKEAKFELNDAYPVVLCWHDNKEKFYPDFRNTQLKKDIIRNLKNERLCQGDPRVFEEWIKNDIGSLIAIPITIGEERVGAISLQHSESYAFTFYHLEGICLLLQRARWALYAVRQSSYRRKWELSFAHEIRGDLTIARDALDAALEDEKLSNSTRRQLLRAMGQSQAVLDLSHNFMAVQNPDIHADIGGFFTQPYEVIEEYLKFNREQMDFCQQKLIISPPRDAPVWRSNLRGDREAFARVIRNLLANCIKFGGDEAEITIKAEAQENFWCIMLENPGHMSEEEERLKFTPWRKPQNVKHEGSHVGLAANQTWIDAYGGELQLGNVPKTQNAEERVRAVLRWPLADS